VDVNVMTRSGPGVAGDCVKEAFGEASTTTWRSAVSLLPRLSVTRSATVCVPALANDFVAVAAVPSSNAPSSSRSHACDAIVAPGPAVEVEVKVTTCCVTGEAGDWPIDAVGGAWTVTWRSAVSAFPRLSVTSRPTV
jgi:hypothetical protein